MPARFYVPDLDPNTGSARLPDDEAHHLVKVLRLEAGAVVGVFDGRGTEWRARVEKAGRDGVEVSLLDLVPSQQPAVDITLVQAVLRGEPMDDVIRDCTMAGVVAIQPILTARTSVKTSVIASAGDRWRRIALASAKQCGAARLPRIADVVRFDEWLQRGPLQSAFMLVEPAVAATPLTIRQLAARPVPPEALLLVGPEGGWADGETERAFGAGCTPLSLGRMTLRADAVPLAAVAALLAIWDE
jgi:16S rRNA (uracil1498-N3)-methyltransferase